MLISVKCKKSLFGKKKDLNSWLMRLYHKIEKMLTGGSDGNYTGSHFKPVKRCKRNCLLQVEVGARCDQSL